MSEGAPDSRRGEGKAAVSPYAGLIPIERNGKRPLIAWEEYQRRPPTAEETAEWAELYRGCNWGQVTGIVSQLVVLDVDPRNRGPESLKGRVVPLTRIVRTPSGGHHYYLKHPGGLFQSAVGILPGVDLRGDRGYVLVPPSSIYGGAYEVVADGPIAPCPVWLLELAAQLRWARVGDGRPKRIPDRIIKGQRNVTLTSLAGTMRRRGASKEAILAALMQENASRCEPPLPEHDLAQIARSVARYPPESEEPPPTGQASTSADPSTARSTPNGPLANGLLFVRYDDLLAEPVEEIRWLVEGRLPVAGTSLIAGRPKAGKYTIARNLVRSVAQGESWLGFATQSGPVLYLALEEKLSEVRRHFEAMNMRKDVPVFIFCARAPHEGVEILRREAERYKPALIIVDPLFRLMRVSDGNDYAQVTAALEPLTAMARETGAHVIAVHHLGKGERQGGDAILGSTAIFAAVDTAFLLKRTERYRTMSSVQRYGEDLAEITLTFDMATRLVAAGPPRQEADERGAMGLILEYLGGQEGPIGEPAILEAVEGSKELTGRSLRRLVREDRVTRTGQGRRGNPFLYSSLSPRAYIQGGERGDSDKSAPPTAPAPQTSAERDKEGQG